MTKCGIGSSCEEGVVREPSLDVRLDRGVQQIRKWVSTHKLRSFLLVAGAGLSALAHSGEARDFISEQQALHEAKDISGEEGEALLTNPSQAWREGEFHWEELTQNLETRYWYQRTHLEMPQSSQELQEHLGSQTDGILILRPSDLPEDFMVLFVKEDRDMVHNDLRFLVIGRGLPHSSPFAPYSGVHIGDGVVLMDTNFVCFTGEAAHGAKGVLIHELEHANNEKAQPRYWPIEDEAKAYYREWQALSWTGREINLAERRFIESTVNEAQKAIGRNNYIVSNYAENEELMSLHPGAPFSALQLKLRGVGEDDFSPVYDPEFSEESVNIEVAHRVLELCSQVSDREDLLEILSKNVQWHKATGEVYYLIFANQLAEWLIYEHPDFFADAIALIKANLSNVSASSDDTDDLYLRFSASVTGYEGRPHETATERRSASSGKKKLPSFTPEEIDEFEERALELAEEYASNLDDMPPHAAKQFSSWMYMIAYHDLSSGSYANAIRDFDLYLSLTRNHSVDSESILVLAWLDSCFGSGETTDKKYRANRLFAEAQQADYVTATTLAERFFGNSTCTGFAYEPQHIPQGVNITPEFLRAAK